MIRLSGNDFYKQQSITKNMFKKDSPDVKWSRLLEFHFVAGLAVRHTYATISTATSFKHTVIINEKSSNFD